MSKFDLDVLHQTISDTQSNICQAVIVKEGKLIYADTWNGYSINDTVHIASATKSVVALSEGSQNRFLKHRAVQRNFAE